MMRSATLSIDALTGNLRDVLQQHGNDVVLDLRGDACGFGIEAVSSQAQDLGFRRALVSPRDAPRSVLDQAPAGQPAIDSWWSGPAGAIMTFAADIVSIKRVPADSPVSYGYHYRTTQETTLVLVGAGYADGVPRTASGHAQISISGTLFPIAGRIAMDQCVVDIGDAEAAVGDQAVIWGDSPSLEDWSQWSSRPPAALLTRIGTRVVKQWV
jgi:alanine racemase